MSRRTKKGQGAPGNGLRVGVTLHLRDGAQSLWENGIYQNVYFLLQLLKNSRRLGRCFLVVDGPGDPSKSKAFLKDAPAPVMTLADAMTGLDVIIELSAQIPSQWGKDFASRGGRIIGMRVANDFMIDAERMAYDLPAAIVFNDIPYDEMWTLPAFAKTCASYYQHVCRAPTRVMPHLWSPELIDRHAKAHGKVFSYQPGRARWRLAILEPNLCSVKTSHVSMVVADVAHRRHPTFIEHLFVFNAMALKEHPSFITFARGLDLVQQGIGTFEPRYPLFEIMSSMSDAIVSHQWENAQNYLYYEALHGGYPLIHNSELLGGCGYRYTGFDTQEGALALIDAFASHDSCLVSYREEAQRFLQTLCPRNDRNIGIFEDRILAVAGRGGE